MSVCAIEERAQKQGAKKAEQRRKWEAAKSGEEEEEACLPARRSEQRAREAQAKRRERERERGGRLQGVTELGNHSARREGKKRRTIEYKDAFGD